MSDTLQIFASPITPKYTEVFYSSIPVDWNDVTESCETCLPCCRDTFTSPLGPAPTLNGEPIK